MNRKELARMVEKAVWAQPVTDLHTHCYSPAFGASPNPRGLLLWGIDELVTYHYLVAEVFRVAPATPGSEAIPSRGIPGCGGLSYAQFWAMSKQDQADHIWRNLFVERTPLSEACRGVVTTLEALGLDPNEKSLKPYRKWFGRQDADKFVDKVMEIANVDCITMTNEVFSEQERTLWEKNPKLGDDPRFAAVLRLDKLYRDWPGACTDLRTWGFDVSADFGGKTIDEARRFLRTWLDRIKAQYVAMSLAPEFRFPDANYPVGDRIIGEILLPVLAERGMPWAMMIGSRRGVNPALKDAGDMGGQTEVLSVTNLCRQFPNNKFMVTLLARENQHELCVAARKFGNLLPFGCWWFLNNPSLIEEMTRMRLELLGTTFVPQHSDARILDQLIYKWEHSRRVIAQVLTDKYADLAESGYEVTKKQVAGDVERLLRGNYRAFVGR